ncbi:hypothetical protein M5K25_027194 [Dendrobium thyrsiflorum]|uniref:Uncharacterized protein n=1 Tax=Dendrobium thyrsiflorum TaxID=117978 RepID=A0ABD0TZQ4_DENTH
MDMGSLNERFSEMERRFENLEDMMKQMLKNEAKTAPFGYTFITSFNEAQYTSTLPFDSYSKCFPSLLFTVSKLVTPSSSHGKQQHKEGGKPTGILGKTANPPKADLGTAAQHICSQKNNSKSTGKQGTEEPNSRPQAGLYYCLP